MRRPLVVGLLMWLVLPECADRTAICRVNTDGWRSRSWKALSEQDAWDMKAYVLSLGEPR
jgi:hypothetical protein